MNVREHFGLLATSDASKPLSIAIPYVVQDNFPVPMNTYVGIQN